MFESLRDRRVTRLIRRVLDDFLPPIVREWRPLNRWMASRFHGPAFDLDFKRRAFTMTSQEFAQAYAALASGSGRYRDTDTTPAQIAAIVAAARGCVLDVGSGNGVVAAALVAAGHDVIAADVTPGSVESTRQRAGCEVVRAALPTLPFADGAVDTVVCAHTLEHVVDLHASVRELRRVGSRVIVVVPNQRYYKYTIDYHLHFFSSGASLEYLLGGKSRQIDGDWFIVSDSSHTLSTR